MDSSIVVHEYVLDYHWMGGFDPDHRKRDQSSRYNDGNLDSEADRNGDRYQKVMMAERGEKSEEGNLRDVIPEEGLGGGRAGLKQANPRDHQFTLVLHAIPHCSDDGEECSRPVRPKIMLIRRTLGDPAVLFRDEEKGLDSSQNKNEDDKKYGQYASS